MEFVHVQVEHVRRVVAKVVQVKVKAIESCRIGEGFWGLASGVSKWSERVVSCGLLKIFKKAGK